MLMRRAGDSEAREGHLVVALRGGTSARRVHPGSGNKTKSFENAYFACLGSSTSLHGSIINILKCV
jgi:hypothetical protein